MAVCVNCASAKDAVSLIRNVNAITYITRDIFLIMSFTSISLLLFRETGLILCDFAPMSCYYKCDAIKLYIFY